MFAAFVPDVLESHNDPKQLPSQGVSVALEISLERSVRVGFSAFPLKRSAACHLRVNRYPE